MTLAKKMSVNRKLSGLNARLPPSFKSWKTNGALCWSNSVRKFRRKSFFVWIFGLVAMGSMLYFIQQHYNFSKKRLHALDSLLSASDQVLVFLCILTLFLLFTCTFCCCFLLPVFPWLNRVVVDFILLC